MKNSRHIFSVLLLLFLIFWVFNSWFSFRPVAARDWMFLYPQNLKELPRIPQLWDNQAGEGMGRFNTYNWSIFCLWWMAKFLSSLGFSWPVIGEIISFWPYLLLSIFSSTFLFKTLFPKNKFWIFAPFLFLFNTFSLIITGGGQMGFALAYAIAPLTLILFIKLLTPNQNTVYQNTINQNKFGIRREFDTRQEFGSGQASSRVNPANFTEAKSGAGGLMNSVLAGVVLGVQAMFDPRVAYITMIAVGVYWVISLLVIKKLTSSRVQELKGSRVNPANFTEVKNGAGGLTSSKRVKSSKLKVKSYILKLKTSLQNLFFIFGVPLAIAVGLNLFWLLPVFLTKGPVLPETYGETGWVEFLSFARFSGALSLLHPFWPENIFGKTYFFRPMFLILPVLAYSSLLFINELTSSRVNEFTEKKAHEFTSLKSKKITNSLINNSLIANKIILYFALLALVGAFLAKGSNPPFGEIYLWLFKNVPGMNMFRDPIKFYVLTAIAYSVLIPFSISRSYEWLRKRFGY